MTDEVKTKSLTEVKKSTSEKRKLEDDSEYDHIAVPPDGGFGWVVLIACFVSNYINFLL
jgi:hypothetical protein